METVGKNTDRRAFFQQAGILVVGAAVASPFFCSSQARSEQKDGERAKTEVSPPEDLMREHGVLRRILLIYEDIRGRLNDGKEFPPESLSSAAEMIHGFIEEYHEKLEEDYLFPRFEKAGKLVDLVKILKEQHKAGRSLTESVKGSAVHATLKQADKRKELAAKLHLFIRMYRPHAACEDTVLFPALRTIVSADEFEDKEVALFGEGGFEKIVAQVGNLEKTLGIYDLFQFTPPK